ncbi:transglutaminaseTgpA domain-containing protein [Actinoplanes sp. NEAU-A12]|uniref:TransglutaminaseTgpA domain-containing protein n=1 Tax=Actinoplanes sandaracinus TaxID=3045177 RepID=A0ABT6WCR9_9ACTN|nr:transglutaminase domain-containing protein [Actinoplanes sandaracinus]MDI6097472.1 transglutaminaseTgpA domain-containing protein [Actinoplanes sandaracinus]
MVRHVRAAVVPLALVGMLTLAGAVLGRIFADDLLFRLAAGAAAGSVGVGVAARRLPSWTVAPLSATLLGGYLALALHLAAGESGLTVEVARDALTNGIPRLLTAMIPVEAAPDTVVIAVAAIWIAGLAATEAAVRGGRVLLGCLPPAAVYGGAVYVVGPNAPAATWLTFAFAGLAGAALAVASGAPGAGTHTAVRVRALGGAAASLLILAAVIAAAGPWVSDRVTATPVDPRRYVQPPRVDSLDESPLNRISGWALDPSQPLLEFQPGAAPAAPAPEAAVRAVRLRLAVLSDYDGVTWKVGGLYRNAGRVLPSPETPAGAEVTETQQRITITGLTGRLLPAVPTPTRITGARVAYDAVSGTLICPEPLSEGLRYTAVSQVQKPDLNRLPVAEAPSGDAMVRYLTVGPGAPPQVQKLADHLAEGNGAAYDRAVAIERFLAEHYRHVADSPSGHAYPNIGHFLFGRRDLGGQRGTSEQFAAAFAVLARLTSLPSRVVVGFAAPAAGGPVTAGDALAWPEVYFDGLGWIAFDPMPKSDEVRPVEEDFTPPTPSPPPSPSDTPPPTGSEPVAPPSALAVPPSQGGPPTVLIASGTSGGLVLLLAGAAFTVAGLRGSQRRRRLTTGDPGQRIAGAWLEFTDALRLAGRPVPAHLSATEAAGHAAVLPRPVQRTGLLRRAVPPSPDDPAVPSPGAVSLAPAEGDPLPGLDALVEAINTAGFAPEAADAGQADRAGAQVVAFADALRGRRSWWRRIWWSARPGPLRWNRS